MGNWGRMSLAGLALFAVGAAGASPQRAGQDKSGTTRLEPQVRIERDTGVRLIAQSKRAAKVNLSSRGFEFDGLDQYELNYADGKAAVGEAGVLPFAAGQDGSIVNSGDLAIPFNQLGRIDVRMRVTSDRKDAQPPWLEFAWTDQPNRRFGELSVRQIPRFTLAVEAAPIFRTYKLDIGPMLRESKTDVRRFFLRPACVSNDRADVASIVFIGRNGSELRSFSFTSKRSLGVEVARGAEKIRSGALNFSRDRNDLIMNKKNVHFAFNALERVEVRMRLTSYRSDLQPPWMEFSWSDDPDAKPEQAEFVRVSRYTMLIDPKPDFHTYTINIGPALMRSRIDLRQFAFRPVCVPGDKAEIEWIRFFGKSKRSAAETTGNSSQELAYLSD